MKPAQFEYVAPGSAEEAVAALRAAGDGAKVLAGGQSLVPLMNMRLARPEVLVDLNRARDLDYVRPLPDGGVAIGAIARQRELEHAPLIRERAPLLTEAAGYIGHFQIRNRGTIVGSLAHADPAAELPAVMSVLGAEFTILGPGGPRTTTPGDFYLTYLTTALGPDELLAEVRVPALPSGSGWSIYEVSRRHGDFALVGAATVLLPSENGGIQSGRIALFGVGPTPERPAAAEQALAGQPPSEALFREVAALAARDLEPEGDVHASAEYRKEVAAVVVRRALLAAAARMPGREATDGR